MRADFLTKAIARVLDQIQLGPRRKYNQKGRWWWSSRKGDFIEKPTDARMSWPAKILLALIILASLVLLPLFASRITTEKLCDAITVRNDTQSAMSPRIAIASPAILPKPQTQPATLNQTSPKITASLEPVSPVLVKQYQAQIAKAQKQIQADAEESERFLVIPDPIEALPKQTKKPEKEVNPFVN